MILKPFIKWTGSKRSQAEEITSYFPKEIDTYYEPFLGSGAILGHLKPKKAVGGDVNKPLIELWKILKEDPEKVAKEYTKHWQSLQDEGHLYFYKIRERFNKKQSPIDFLFLTRTCVNGLIRYNKNGEFNNSLHHTRKGMNPEQLRKIILQWAILIKSYRFSDQSYEITTKDAGKNDFVYLDPPYANTGTRYFGGIDYDNFISYLEQLNKKGIKFALSFDGTRGDKSFVVEIPKHLYKRHILVHSGNSAFNKVQNGKVEKVHESLYLNY